MRITINAELKDGVDYSIRMIPFEDHLLIIPLKDIEARMKELKIDNPAWIELEKLLLNPNYNR